MRTVVVGLGIGWYWVREILKRPDSFELVGIVDIVKDRVDNMRNALELSEGIGFLNLQEALRKTKPQLCIIATPPMTHKELIKMAADAGANIICEKPLAYEFCEAAEAVRIAERAGVRLVVNQNYRFAHLARNAKRVLEEGRIGEPGYARIEFFKYNPDPKNYRVNTAHVLLLEMGVHHFDLIRFLLGEIEEICAYEFKTGWSWYKGESVVCASVVIEGGVGVSYMGSLVSMGKGTPWEGNWRIEGEKGTLIFGERGNDFGIFVSEKDEVEKLPLDATPQGQASFGAVLDEFVRTGEHGQRMPNEGEDNLRTLAASFAAIRSWQERRWVSLGEVLEEVRR